MKDTYIIKKRGTFRYTFLNGEKYSGKFVNIYINKFTRKSSAFAVCVSKKNGNSVFRNKLKRWTREVYRSNYKNLINGITIIISFKKHPIENIDYKSLLEDVKKGLSELNVYKNKYNS